MTIDFEEAKRKRDDDPERVRCARCGDWIHGRLTRCPKCGVYFQGEAFQFSHESDRADPGGRHRRGRVLLLAMAAAVLIIILIAALFSR